MAYPFLRVSSRKLSNLSLHCSVVSSTNSLDEGGSPRLERWVKVLQYKVVTKKLIHDYRLVHNLVHRQELYFSDPNKEWRNGERVEYRTPDIRRRSLVPYPNKNHQFFVQKPRTNSDKNGPRCSKGQFDHPLPVKEGNDHQCSL